MKDVVKNLREGWYGNGDDYPVGHPLRKQPVDCRKLWQKCLDIAGTKFVTLCEGITGKIGSLVETEDFTNEPVDIPIDTLVIDMTREDSEDDDFGRVMEVWYNHSIVIDIYH